MLKEFRSGMSMWNCYIGMSVWYIAYVSGHYVLQ